MEEKNCESVKANLTGLLMAINPDIASFDYVCDYASTGRVSLVKMAVLSFKNGQSRTIDLLDSSGIRESIIAIIASCYQKSGGGKRIVKRKKGKEEDKKW